MPARAAVVAGSSFSARWYAAIAALTSPACSARAPTAVSRSTSSSTRERSMPLRAAASSGATFSTSAYFSCASAPRPAANAACASASLVRITAGSGCSSWSSPRAIASKCASADSNSRPVIAASPAARSLRTCAYDDPPQVATSRCSSRCSRAGNGPRRSSALRFNAARRSKSATGLAAGAAAAAAAGGFSAGACELTRPGRTKKVKPAAASAKPIAPTSRPRRKPSLRSALAEGASPFVRCHCGCTGKASAGGRGCQVAMPGAAAAAASPGADSSSRCSSSCTLRMETGRSAGCLARQRATSARKASGGAGLPATGGGISPCTRAGVTSG